MDVKITLIFFNNILSLAGDYMGRQPNWDGGPLDVCHFS